MLDIGTIVHLHQLQFASYVACLLERRVLYLNKYVTLFGPLNVQAARVQNNRIRMTEQHIRRCEAVLGQLFKIIIC